MNFLQKSLVLFRYVYGKHMFLDLDVWWDNRNATMFPRRARFQTTISLHFP